MREIKVAKSAGFCFGVKRAVDESLKIQKEFNKKIKKYRYGKRKRCFEYESI